MLKELSALPLLAGFILLVEPLHAIAQEVPQPPPQPPQWYWYGPWHGPWVGLEFWWIWPLMMLVMFLVFGALFFFFGRGHHWESPCHMMDRTWGSATHSALQILNERFARGEIEKDEYEEKKAAILSGGQH